LGLDAEATEAFSPGEGPDETEEAVMSAADDLDVLRERFRKLAALAKGNGHEGAVAAERAAAMLRQHGDDVLRPPDPEWLARCAEADRVRRARAAEATFRRGTRKWGTPEEKVALEAVEAEERAAFWTKWEAEEPLRKAAREAAREAALEAKRAEDRERRRQAKIRRAEREREEAERQREEAVEAAKRQAKKVAETRAARAAWEAERERRCAAGKLFNIGSHP
jgi:hypothetical protein